MDSRQAYEESIKKAPGSRSPRCLWHCGLINGEIKKAAKLGETKVSIDFPPKHYAARHRELFKSLYENQGYRVTFEPDYKYIQPSKWTLTIDWSAEAGSQD